MRRALLSALALVALAGCHNPDAYVLGPDRADEVLGVTPSATSIPADGIARVTIVAQLDPRTDNDKRTVKFTTSAGTLIGGGKEGPTTDVAADTTGRATVELRSSTSPGTARLDVVAGTVARTTTVEFTPVASQDLYEVVVNPPAVPANGFSTSRVTVQLKRLGTPQQRVVKFEASAGTLIGAGVTTPHSANVQADADGLAAVDLQSEKSPGLARLLITALDTTREVTIEFVPADPGEIITLSLQPSSVAADGTTPITAIAQVAPALPSARRSVTFRTTAGKFLPGSGDSFTIEADGSNTARAVLVSAVTGVARVTATVDGTSASTTAEFTEARPDSLFVSVSAATLEADDSTKVTVTLLREVGTPSPRQQVTYTALTPGGVLIGAFSDIMLSNGSGESSATFNVGPTAYVGPLTIRASVGSVVGTAVVQITP
jgi:hypothetical protein